MGGGAEPKNNTDTTALVRTEFVLLFVWREPGPPAVAPPTDEKK
jgi:hypothetical protein